MTSHPDEEAAPTKHQRAHPAGPARQEKGKGAVEVESGAGDEAEAVDRDSEGVYYMSVEDFERRITPKPSKPGSGQESD